MSAVPILVAPEPAPDVHWCPSCGEPGVVMLGYEIGRPVPVVEGVRPAGRLVMVRYGSRWGVRDRLPGERVPVKFLRLLHECRPHLYECMTPGCTAKARLFPGGTFCEDDRP